MSTIPFDEIVPGATARFTVMDNVQYLSVRDVIVHVCGKNNKQASQIWARLSDDQLEEVSSERRNFLFPGQGQSEQPVLTFRGILKLVMWIGGGNAKKYRSAMVHILQRYYAGDTSLLEEVEANAQSDAPIPKTARASLAAETVSAEPVQDDYALERKRKLDDIKYENMQLDLVMKKHESEKLELDLTISRRKAELDVRFAEFEYATKITSTYRELCQDTVMDTRARLMFQDYYLNMIMPLQAAPARQVTDGLTLAASPLVINKPVSLSQMATRMGLKIPTGDLISLGVKLRKLYETKYGHPPGKHDQLCDGRMTKVNSYMESDCPLIEEVLSEWQTLRVS